MGVVVLAWSSPDGPNAVLRMGGRVLRQLTMRPLSQRDRLVHQYLFLAGALAQWLRDRALMVPLPMNACAEAPWTHQSLDQGRPEGGGSWLGGLAAPDSRSPETEKARDVGLEAMVDQLPTERWTGFSGQPPSLTSEVGHRP